MMLLLLACAEVPCFVDADGDGFGDPFTSTACEAGVDNRRDCDDGDAAVAPSAAERCNSRDDDCDGFIDEYPEDPTLTFVDADGDGHGDPAQPTLSEWCFATVPPDDCDDSSAAVSPDGVEVCGDGLDNDCVDGDEACPNAGAVGSLFDAAWQLPGTIDDGAFGEALLPMGSELIVAAPSAREIQFVTPGQPARLTIDTPESRAGQDLALVPDLDGDGVQELIVDRLDGSTRLSVHRTAGAGLEIDAPIAWLQATDTRTFAPLVYTDRLIAGLQGAPGVCAVPLALGELFAGDCITGGANLGMQLVALGDVDGDGLDDLALGGVDDVALAVTSGWTPGAVEDVATPIAFAAGWESATVSFVAPGDVDGDGHADLFATALGYTNSLTSAGRGWVVRGPTFPASLDDADVVLLGIGYTGYARGGVGDLDGDGLPDLAVLSYTDTDAGPNPIACFFDPEDGEHDVGDADRIYVGFRGSETATLTGGGDLDGDGHGELIVGAYEAFGRGVVYGIEGF